MGTEPSAVAHRALSPVDHPGQEVAGWTYPVKT